MTKPRRYGSWAGCPAGVAEDVTCCIFEVWPNDRAPIPHQCNRKRGHGKGGLYCAQHDPERMAAKRHARETAWRDRDAASAQNERVAKKLAKRLGAGQPHYLNAFKLKDSGYTEDVLLSFAEVEQLLKELGR